MSRPHTLAMKQPTRLQSFGRMLLMVCALVFALQLAAATQHNHAVGGLAQDCASCVLSHHVPAPPAPAPVLAPFAALLLACLLPALPVARIVAQASYLIPDAQAPPRAS